MPARDIVLLLLVVLSWALNFLTSAYALREIPPLLGQSFLSRLDNVSIRDDRLSMR